MTVNMKKKHPITIKSLKVIVEDFLSGMHEDLMQKIARHVRKRAVLCVQDYGGHFEHLM